MKNTLRLSFGLLAAIAMLGCQKNPGQVSTTVRGRSGPSITAATAGSSGSPQTAVNVDPSQLAALSNLVSSEVPANSIGEFKGMTVAIHLCSKNLPPSDNRTPITPSGVAAIEVAVTDSNVSSSVPPITTKLPFLTGYTQNSNGYLYIAAEFGDGTGNIAFNGYIDTSSGTLVQGQLYNDTFSVNAGLQQIGSFQLEGSSWITGCN